MKKLIFFDWDGTIVSTKIAEKANLKRTELIQEDFDKENLLNLQRNNGDNHYKLIQDMIKIETGIENSDEIKRMQVYLFSFFYLKYFRANPEKYLLFDLKKLKQLKKEYNLKLIIITGLFKEIIWGNLNKIDPDKEIFDDAWGIENNITGEKFDMISEAMKKYSDYEPFLMIGDKQGDIEPGIKHNLKTILCNYGHGSSSDATLTIEEPSELIPAIERLLKD